MTSGFLAAIIILPILVVALVVGSFFLLRYAITSNGYSDDRTLAGVTGGILGVAALAVVIIGAISLLPYDMAYHSYRTHAGVVSSNKATQQQQDWVITFQGSNRQYDCGETRCSQALPGDTLELRCVKSNVWQATDYYDCLFGSLHKKAN